MLFGHVIWLYLCEIAVGLLFAVDIIVFVRIAFWLKNPLFRKLWAMSIFVHVLAVIWISMGIADMLCAKDHMTRVLCALCWIVPFWAAIVWSPWRYAPKKKKPGDSVQVH